jgi:hypothetical protein
MRLSLNGRKNLVFAASFGELVLQIERRDDFPARGYSALTYT